MENIQIVKSAMAETGGPATSENYQHINTGRVLAGFLDNGWKISKQRETATRDPNREGFQKHYIRLRRDTVNNVTVNDYLHEIEITASHDGSSAFKISHGIFRVVCSNGLTVSAETVSAMRIIHRGGAAVNYAAVLDKFNVDAMTVAGKIQQFKSTPMAEDARLDFAQRALDLRYSDDRARRIHGSNMLRARRSEDRAADLWTTLNVVQEKVIRGGGGYFQENPNRQHNGRFVEEYKNIRPLTSIDEIGRVNRGIWALGEKFAGRTN